jgi:hypothetical protein
MIRRILACTFFVLALIGCSSHDTEKLPSQQWEGVVVRIETRPTPVQAGMNEFWIILNDSRGRPAHDLIVSLRSSGQKTWVQAIQDGHTGVFRRALRVKNPESDVLVVRLQRHDEDATEGELVFPLVIK